MNYKKIYISLWIKFFHESYYGMLLIEVLPYNQKGTFTLYFDSFLEDFFYHCTTKDRKKLIKKI